MLTFAIPTWNRAPYLKICILSIIDQALTVNDRIKILVYDNHSDDETPQLLEELKVQFPSIIDFVRNDETCDVQINFMKCFSAPDTEWTWTMGDDDMLVKDALPMALRIIKQSKYKFMHVAETTRFASEKAIYPGTLLYLCEKIGFTEMTAFISCNICRTDYIKKAFSSAHMDVFNESSFSQSLALLEVLANENCAYVNIPMVELQEKEQTADVLKRWTDANLMMRYNKVVKGLKLLVIRLSGARARRPGRQPSRTPGKRRRMRTASPTNAFSNSLTGSARILTGPSFSMNPTRWETP